jgi:drug/metabolite transporter (DMT)-like permease
MGAVFGSLTAISIGFSDILGRRVSNATSPVTAAGVMQLFAGLSALAAGLFVSSELLWGDVGRGAISGLGMAVGLSCYYRGVERSSSAVVAPLVATLSAVIPYGYTLVGGTSPTALALLGALVALAGLLLITLGGASIERVRSGVRWGLASGLGYGIGLTIVIDTSSESGIWPSVSQRVTALALLVLVAFGLGVERVPPPGLRALTAAAGAVAGLSTVFYIAGVQIDAQPAVVTASMFPAASVLGGWVFYEDEVSPTQTVGIGVVLAGVAGVVLG